MSSIIRESPPTPSHDRFSVGLYVLRQRSEPKSSNESPTIFCVSKSSRNMITTFYSVIKWAFIDSPQPAPPPPRNHLRGQLRQTLTAFDVKLEKFDPAAKLKVIKEIRSFTDLALKEAKDLVEKSPTLVKKGVTMEEAEKIVAKLKEVAATAVLE